MDRFAWMQAFVVVAEKAAFAAAARRLGLSPPAVTRAISALEAHLGVQLLQRTTRKVRLTEVGARYLIDCKRLLGELDDVEDAARGAHGALRGQLGVTASVMFGRLVVAPILLDFLAAHQHVTLRTLFIDSVVDLIDEGLDVAVRIAKLSDSTLTAVKVGAVRRVVCAAPAYLKKHGLPKSPKDLSELRAIVFSSERSVPTWAFESGANTITLRPKAELLVNSSEVAIAAAVRGVGVTRVLSYMVAEELRTGRLRVVLEDYEPEPLPIHLLYREGRRASARVRAFVDYAVPRLRAHTALHPKRLEKG